MLGVSFSFRFVFSLFVLLGVGVCCGCPCVCFVPPSFFAVCCVPVGGVCGGLVVLLLRVLGGCRGVFLTVSVVTVVCVCGV